MGHVLRQHALSRARSASAPSQSNVLPDRPVQGYGTRGTARSMLGPLLFDREQGVHRRLLQSAYRVLAELGSGVEGHGPRASWLGRIPIINARP